MACAASAQVEEPKADDASPGIELLLFLAEFPDEAATLVDPIETADNDGGNENDQSCDDNRCPDGGDAREPPANSARAGLG